MRIIREFYRDPYGCTASITHDTATGKCLLTVRIPHGDLIHSKTYDTHKGARIALGKMSEGMMEQTGREER